jgi:predicted GNAT family acetyltransferase
MNTKIETLPVADLTDADTAALQQLREAVYPPGEHHRNEPTSLPAPDIDWPEAQQERIFFVRDGRHIVATARFLPSRIRTTEGWLDIHALAGVKTHPDHRQKGLGRAVVQAAFEYVDNGTFPVSFFQTGVPEFYHRLGCREVSNPCTNCLAEDPTACPWWENHVMIYPADAHWPDGPIDLLGPAW